MTEQPPIQPTPVGALRFNTDIARLEYFNGSEYVNITIDSPETNTGGTRGLFYGGNTPSNRDRIEFINVDSTGNSVDFGNLLSAQSEGGSGSADRSRGLISGGSTAGVGNNNIIQFVTIASAGNAVDFGDCVAALKNRTACSDVHGGLAQ